MNNPISHPSRPRHPVRLTCEYLTNPSGIDLTQPRLSWQLDIEPSKRGVSQQHYRLGAASSRDLLDRDHFDLWDSGVVESSERHLIPWGGSNLVAGQRVFWKVRAGESDESLSAWSEPAYFDMGPMAESDWCGHWIGYPYPQDDTFMQQATRFVRRKAAPWGIACEGAPTLEATLFRRSVSISRLRARHGVVHLAVRGQAELWVNGQRADDRFFSPMTSSDCRLRYVSYDVSCLLREGKNVFGVILCTSPYRIPDLCGNQGDNVPQFRFQSYADGEVLMVSDAEWGCGPMEAAPRRLMTEGMAWNRYDGSESTEVSAETCSLMGYGGELVWAERDTDRWAAVEFDDSGWAPARCYTVPPFQLSAEKIEPDRVIAELRPVSMDAVVHAGRKGWRIDFGRNFTGVLDFSLKGTAEAVVDFCVADRFTEIDSFRQPSRLILDRKGRGRFRHRFNWCSGRWVTVFGDIEAPEAKNLRAFAVSTDVSSRGGLQTSSHLLNAIVETDLRTMRANFLNGVVFDSPHRERRGYGNEGGLTVTHTILPYFHSGAAVGKLLEDWADSQNASGRLPHAAPQNCFGGGPAWGSAVMDLAWRTWLEYADNRLLERAYAMLQRWLAFLEEHAPDGILQRYEAYNEWCFLGDWTRPRPGKKPMASGSRDPEVVGQRWEWHFLPAAHHYNNCVYAWTLSLGERMARALGHESDALRYGELLGHVRATVHEAFYKPAEKVYLDHSQMRQAFALLAGIPPEQDRPDVVESLIADITGPNPFFDAGNGVRFLWDCLLDVVDRPDILVKVLLREEYPGYADLLLKGATTWPEYWDFSASQVHTSYTGISGCLSRALTGLRPDPSAPGYRRFSIRPWFDPRLEWVESCRETPQGNIRIAWRRDADSISFTCSVPPDSTADVWLPAGAIALATENGLPLADSEGVVLAGETEGKVRLVCPSGEYRFRFNRDAP